MKPTSDQLILDNVMLRQRIAELQAQLQFMPNTDADIWRTLADNVREYAVFQLDRQGCITDWNQGAEGLFRYGAAEVIGQRHAVLLTEEGRAAGQPDEALRLAELNGRHEGEGWRVSKGGRRFWATAILIAKRDAQGELTGFVSITRDNSDHRQASEHIASANTRFQRLFRSIRQGILFIDKHDVITLANPAASDMLGVPREELLTRNLHDPRWRIIKLNGEPLSHDDFQLMTSAASQFFARNHIIGVFNPQYGDHRWFQVSVDADARMGEGAPGQTLLGLTDVTESVQAQRSLQQREGWLNGILHTVPGYICTVDCDGRILFINRLSPGVTHDQVIGSRFTDWIVPEHRQASWDLFQRVIATRSVLRMEQLVGADHEAPVWHEVSYCPVIVDDQVRFVTATLTPIDDRKKAELALRDSERWLRMAYDAASLGAWQYDIQQGVVHLDPRASEMYGFATREIPADALLARVHPDDMTGLSTEVARLLDPQGSGRSIVEYRVLHPDGSVRWLSVVLQVIFGGDDHLASAVFGTCKDISDRKAAEVALQRQLAQITLLAELSRDLAAASTERMDELLASALARLGAFLAADSAFLACAGLDGCGIDAVHQWRADGLCGGWDAGALSAMHKPLVAALGDEPLQSLTVRLADVADMPAGHCKTLLQAVGAKTGMFAPIHAGDRLMGIVCVYWTGAVATWDVETDAMVHRTCALLAGAGLRWQAERAMLELNQTLEDRVRERTAEVSDLYNNAPCGYHSLDLDSRILYINDTELRWLGYTREEVIGRPISDFVAPASVEAIQRARQMFLEQGWTKDVEYECVRRDGSILPVLVSSSAVRDAQGRIVSTRATLIDDSDRRQALRALRASEARLRDSHEQISAANALLSQALRVKDEFLSSMSHELRTPLTAILGLSEGLQEQSLGPLTPVQAEALATIEASGRHLLNLINDILDLAKVEAGALQLQIAPVNVEAVCSASVAMIRELASRKRLTLSVTRDAGAQWVRADERRLRQMLVNLLGNAVKFTPEGGSVCVDVRGDSVGNALHIAVCDTGIGIAEDDLARLFKPFVQLDSALSRQYEGTGLGLSLVMRMAQLHGGSIGVTSTPGQGSRFTIQLPWFGDAHARDELDAGPADAAGPASGPASGEAPAPTEIATGLLLLADDNPATLQTIGGYLRSHGYEVLIAHNGEQALTLAHEQRPDLLLMDVQMPVLDGVEALRRLRGSVDPELAGMPVIALSALAMQADRERVLAAGATAYLAKPVGMRQLYELVGDVLKDACDGCKAGGVDCR